MKRVPSSSVELILEKFYLTLISFASVAIFILLRGGTSSVVIIRGTIGVNTSKSSNLKLYATLGLAAAAVSSCVLHLLPEIAESLPLDFSPKFEQTVALCFISLLVSTFHVTSIQSQIKRQIMNMPEVPPEVPILGSIQSFLTNVPWDLMERWHKQYGGIYRYTLLGRTCVALADPAHLKIVLQSKIKHVKKDVGFAYKPFLPILGKGKSI